MTNIKIQKFFLLLLILGFLSFAFFYPLIVIDGIKKGITLSFGSVIPSMFPFFVVTEILVSSGIAVSISRYFYSFFEKAFNISGAGSIAFLIGAFAGFPVGANAAASLYKSGQISKTDAEILLSFCNNASFAFVTQIVGVCVFGNIKYGLYLYCVSLIASAIFGAILGKFKGEIVCLRLKSSVVFNDVSQIITIAIKKSCINMAFVCGFIVFFSGISSAFSGSFFVGILELASGIMIFEGSSPTLNNLIFSVLLINFSGICVFLQIKAMLLGSGLSLKYYYQSRIIVPLIACLIVLITYKFL